MITEAIVASVIAGSSVCSDHFENVSRFNPSDLSDYQQCVHIAHENNSGVIGNYLWVRTGYDFTYVPMKQIQSLSSKKARTAYVHQQVIATLQAQHDAQVQEAVAELRNNINNDPILLQIVQEFNLNLEEIKSLEEFASALIQIIDATTEAIDTLFQDIEDYRADIEELEGQVEDLEALRDTLRGDKSALDMTIETLRGQIEDKDMEISRLDGEVERLEGVVAARDRTIAAVHNAIGRAVSEAATILGDAQELRRLYDEMSGTTSAPTWDGTTATVIVTLGNGNEITVTVDASTIETAARVGYVTEAAQTAAVRAALTNAYGVEYVSIDRAQEVAQRLGYANGTRDSFNSVTVSVADNGVVTIADDDFNVRTLPAISNSYDDGYSAGYTAGEASVWESINDRIDALNTMYGTTFAHVNSVADIESLVDQVGDDRVNELVESLNAHANITATFNAETNMWTWDVSGVREAGRLAGVESEEGYLTLSDDVSYVNDMGQVVSINRGTRLSEAEIRNHVQAAMDGAAAAVDIEHTVTFSFGSTEITSDITDDATFNISLEDGQVFVGSEVIGNYDDTYEITVNGVAYTVAGDGMVINNDPAPNYRYDDWEAARDSGGTAVYDNTPNDAPTDVIRVTVVGSGYDIAYTNNTLPAADDVNLRLDAGTAAQLDEVLERIYSEGYDDGYEAGYNAGYEDGFAAGRATR